MWQKHAFVYPKQCDELGDPSPVPHSAMTQRLCACPFSLTFGFYKWSTGDTAKYFIENSSSPQAESANWQSPHNLFAAIGHRSKRERASSSASPEIIPSMIVHCINNNTCTVGIYLIHGVSDKMLDLAAIKRDWTAKLLFSPLIDAKT